LLTVGPVSAIEGGMLRVVIIGSGVAGGVIARGLRRLPGLEVTLIEQVAEHDHLMAGNGLNIGPNALLALSRVLPDMATELRAASLPWTRWQAGLISGAPLYEIPLADVAACSGIRIRWSELYRIARQPVADLTRYETRFTEVEIEAGKPRITVERVADGRRETIRDIDLLIACDGRYSRVREQLCGAPSIQHLGVANFRLLIDDNGKTGIDDLEQWYCGPARLLFFRLKDGRVYLSGNNPLEPGAEITDEQKTVAYMRRAYLPASGPVEPRCALLMDETFAGADSLHWSRAQEIDTRFHDQSGRVLFVGDCAHAMAPTLGQGATQALEDGAAFVALFRTLSERGALDVAALTAAYDGLRRERIEFVKRFSWDASEPLLIGRDPVVTNRDRTTPAYHAKLRRMYTDLGFGAAAHAAV
jgi:salicylate hydroxylase